MHKFTELLITATSRIIQQYFHLNIDGGDPVYRERVYCYELYHQLRSVWPDVTKYYLNGELDKAAHPILRELGADYAKPDFLIHTPGSMKGNNTIIEVKSSKAQSNGIIKDLKTLSLFRERVGYKRAIYLVFGYDAAEIVEQVQQIASGMHCLQPIELWLHEAPSKPAAPNRLITSDWLTVC